MKQEVGAMSRKKKTLYEALGQTLKLEVIKLAAESSIKIPKMTGHYGGVSPFQNERRDVKTQSSAKKK
jgi:hypothetical protein